MNQIGLLLSKYKPELVKYGTIVIFVKLDGKHMPSVL